ncbi:MAG: WYL domain-containing protein [Gallionella sp.]|nr:WYL domain-containing protein [Gallionella sp.]MDD4945351.1 WYL domain-containing protein [Gallionella sp.]MDD5612099.1 WYL domain-containing protein [Gallionella sp.]
MPKRPDTQATLLLALELMRRIPRTRKVTAKELHEQLADSDHGRDLRTIQRQLEMLSEHFEIERDDRSKPYGYRWKERAQGMALPMLTEQESLLLTLAEQHLKALLPVGLMKTMDSFFTQARANLAPYSNAKREREWLKKVRVVSTSQPLLPPKIKPGVFEQVSNALYANQWLAVDYENAAGKRTEADVMPLGLAQQGPRLYLVCRFRDFDNERSLALHRLHAAQASTLTFERPENFDLEQYDNDGRFGFGEGKKIRLTFRIEKATGLHLLESPLSEDQQVVELDDAYEITATVVDTAMLDWWLRGFGDSVKVISKCAVVV